MWMTARVGGAHLVVLHTNDGSLEEHLAVVFGEPILGINARDVCR